MARPIGSVFLAVSVDGYIARPDGRTDWLSSVERPGEDYGYRRFFDSVDAMVMGRKTYDAALGFGEWPYGDKRCVVLTHRPPAKPRRGETFYAGHPAALMERLATEGVRRVYVDGGAVVSEFLRLGLVDDLTLSVIPVVLGEGVALFNPPAPERALALESCESFPSGLVQLRYRVAG